MFNFYCCLFGELYCDFGSVCVIYIGVVIVCDYGSMIYVWKMDFEFICMIDVVNGIFY